MRKTESIELASVPFGKQAYYVLQAYYSETLGRCGDNLDVSKLPMSQPDYYVVVQMIRKGLPNITNNPRLVEDLTEFLSFGNTWNEVYSVISVGRNIEKYDRLFKIILANLSTITTSAAPGIISGIINLDSKLLDADMKFYKVNVSNLKNNLPKELRNISVGSKNLTNPSKTYSGNPLIHLHNPLREHVIFAKDRFLKERFCSYIIPFMKQRKLSVYLCSIETMIGYIASRHAVNGVLNLAAVSKKDILKDGIDDRTLFLVLTQSPEGWRVIELAYGDIISTVPLIHMETLAFCAGLFPDDLIVNEYSGEFMQSNRDWYPAEIRDPRIALLGWWNATISNIVRFYFMQNLSIILIDFVFEVLRHLEDRNMAVDEDDDIFEKAMQSGFNIASAISSGFRPGFRYQFYNYLQTYKDTEFTDNANSSYLEVILHVLSLTKFNEDPESDIVQRRNEAESVCKQYYITNRQEVLILLKKSNIFYTDKSQWEEHWASQSKRKTAFTVNQYKKVKNFVDSIPEIVQDAETVRMIKEELNKVFNNPINLEIGNKKLISYPILSNVPVETIAGRLIEAGYKSFIFYGTSGGIKNIPPETMVIPEVIYIYPKDMTKISPENYTPIPVSNSLISQSASHYFNTANFYKTHHVFVASTYQETKNYLTRALEVFNKESYASVDMDVAPLANLCLEKNASFGCILFNTDMLTPEGGLSQDEHHKAFYMRQLMLSFLRAYDAKVLNINGHAVEELFINDFLKIAGKLIDEALH